MRCIGLFCLVFRSVTIVCCERFCILARSIISYQLKTNSICSSDSVGFVLTVFRAVRSMFVAHGFDSTGRKFTYIDKELSL